MYAGYLRYGAPDTKLAYKNGRLEVVRHGRWLVFHRDSSRFSSDGLVRDMHVKPVMVDGRFYIPIEAIRDELPFAITFDGRARTVRFDASPRLRAL